MKRFAQQGIKHVRFRLHHYHFTDEDFKRLFSQINTCMQNELIPIIAFSAKPYKENPNAGEHEKVVEWWKRMAERCKELSPMVSFDLIVEPSDQVKKMWRNSTPFMKIVLRLFARLIPSESSL